MKICRGVQKLPSLTTAPLGSVISISGAPTRRFLVVRVPGSNMNQLVDLESGYITKMADIDVSYHEVVRVHEGCWKEESK